MREKIFVGVLLGLLICALISGFRWMQSDCEAHGGIWDYHATRVVKWQCEGARR